MTEGRTSVDERDTEVEPASATSVTEGTTGTGATSEHDPATGRQSEDASEETTEKATGSSAAETASTTDTHTADGTTPAVGTEPESEPTTEPEPRAGDTVSAATLPGDQNEQSDAEPTEDEGRHAAAESGTDGDDDWADAEDKAYQRELRKGLAFGVAGGLVLGAIVALLLGAFVWPGYLIGPGSPDDTANKVVTALAAKDSGALDQVSCKGADGAPISQLSPQIVQLITAVKPSGPTTALIDTEARTPVDLTVSLQGQTQTLPSDLVLGQTDGSWCLKGLGQRQ